MSDDNCLDASVPPSLINQLNKKSASYRHLTLKFGASVEDKLRKKIFAVPIKLFRCHNMGGNQRWKYNFDTKQIIHINSGLCLDKPIAQDLTLPVLNICNEQSKSQIWLLNSNFKWQVKDDKHQNSNDNDVDSDM